MQRLLLVCAFLAAGSLADPLRYILDTDIGDDFDDSWALCESLTDPSRWDLKMVLTAAHDTYKRALVVAKYLTLYNRTDIPIGIGIKTDDSCGALYPWAEDIDLKKYVQDGGTVFYDGVAAAVQMIEAAKPGEELSIVGIAPMTNLGEIAKVYPKAAQRVPNVYAMYGGVNYCYGHQKVGPNGCKEYNVVENVTASQNFIHGPWKITITPLDTCEYAMDSAPYDRMLAANNTAHPYNNALLSSLAVWAKAHGLDPSKHSDTLFDPTAVYLAASRDGFGMEEVKLSLKSDGSMIKDPDHGVPINCALTWKSVLPTSL